ncbi:MAG TPA: hypothetical protein VF523_14395 [Burkholderiales bacterium]
MVDLLSKAVVGKLASRALDWVGALWHRRKAKRALVRSSVRPKLDFSELVPAKLARLVQGGLPQEFDKSAIREWLSDSETQEAFVVFYEAHQAGSQGSASVPIATLEARFEHFTGETRKHAFPYIYGIRDFLDTTFFGSATEAETSAVLLLRLILRYVTQPDSLDVPSLRTKVKRPCSGLIDRGKKRWQYPGATVPTRMEIIGSGIAPPAAPDIVGMEDVYQMVREGANLFVEGEAGSGKTTALIDLCTMLLRDDTSPIITESVQ